MYEIEDTFWWYVGMRRATAALLDSALGPISGLRILDAGCGTGANLRFLRRYGKPIGIDLSKEALKFAASRRPEWLTLGTVSNLPFADSSFDLVTSFEVLYHLAVQDDMDALRELARVLKPGGWLLVRVPAYNWLRGSHDRAVQTRHRYTATELRRKIEALGLLVQRTTYLNTALFPVAAAKRAVEMLTGGGSGESDLKPINPALNRAFTETLATEGGIAAQAPLPFGLSVLCLAKKV